MKRCKKIITLLGIMSIAFTIIVILLTQIDYRLTIKNHLVCSGISTAVFIKLVIDFLKQNVEKYGIYIHCIAWLLFPLTVVNLFAHMTLNDSGILPCVFYASWIICAIAVELRIAKGVIAQILVGFVILNCIGLFFFGFWAALFGSIGKTTVIATAYSPGGSMRAEILDVDEGALGGDTVVNVYFEDKSYDFIVFKIEKYPKMIYRGEWGEFKDMTIEWEDESTLLINDERYDVL